MSPFLTLRVALRALSRNKLRTALTMLGIIIGVAAVVAMLSIGAGAQAAVKSSLSGLGANTIELYPGYRRGRNRGVAGNARELKLDDWRALQKLPEVRASYPLVSQSSQVIFGPSNWNTTVVGTNEEYFEVMSWPVRSGRHFTDSEVNSGSLVAVLGKKVARELFGGTNPIGESLRIQGFPFKVVGVLTEKGGTSWENRDDTIVVPYLAVMGKLRGTNSIGRVILQATSDTVVSKMEQKAKDLLNRRHRITDPADGGFNSYNQAEASSVVDESTKIFSMLLGGVASVSLLVGGIGIMNIMLVSVTERVKEIGIRMAVGARGRDILTQFLSEAVLISVAGGAVGIMFGAGIAHWVAGLAGWPTILNKDAIILAFTTSAAIGVFFGFYPAYQASKLDPIQALRKE